MGLDKVEKIDRDIDRPLQHFHARFDIGRSGKMLVMPNVNKHVHITFGRNEVTMILHPHAARRLIKAIEAVLDGNEFDRG